jgi:hypothetical protein
VGRPRTTPSTDALLFDVAFERTSKNRIVIFTRLSTPLRRTISPPVRRPNQFILGWLHDPWCIHITPSPPGWVWRWDVRFDCLLHSSFVSPRPTCHYFRGTFSSIPSPCTAKKRFQRCSRRCRYSLSSSVVRE